MSHNINLCHILHYWVFMTFYDSSFDKSLWTGRPDAFDQEYIYQIIEPIDLAHLKPDIKPGYALLGFQSDIGIQRNFGNIGASYGPIEFRKALAKMAIQEQPLIYDGGNVSPVGNQLERAQKILGELVKTILDHRLFPIVIGGGHETAWGHFQGIHAHFLDQDIAILNFDAHFDLRHSPQSTSGTPFRQIQQHLKENKQSFYYYCVGIQPHANTQSLFNYSKAHHVKYLLAQDIHENPSSMHFIQDIIARHERIYVSICLDVFAASVAPGVSAPQPLGIFPDYVIRALNILKASQKVVALDIVELSPKYDIQQHTAKLAAALIHSFL